MTGELWRNTKKLSGYLLPPLLEELWDFEGRSDFPDLPASCDLPELSDLDETDLLSALLSDLDSALSAVDFEVLSFESESDFEPESDFESESLFEDESPLEDDALAPDFFA